MIVDHSYHGIIAVLGADRTRWLQGMVTNDIAGLAPGQTTYCFFLDAQGHILADAHVLVEAERILVYVEPEVTAKLLKWLDHYIIMDDVELADISPSAIPARSEAMEALRIERGIPRYGVDIDETTLPQETGQLHAIHFNKGCYIGQEIVERIRSRGHVNRMLVRLESSELLEPGAAIEAEGREIGRITSAARSPTRDVFVALGYVRREFAELGRELSSQGKRLRTF